MVWPKVNLMLVQVPGDHDAGEEIGNHSDGLEFLGEIFFFGGNVEAGGGADFGIFERSGDGTEIIGLYADVAVGDDEEIVFGFGGEARKAADFCR